MKKKVVFPGSFDPIHYGHINIIKKAQKIFKLTIAISNNFNKKHLFTLNQRIELIEQNCKACKVRSFNGLLIDFLKKENINIIIRGIRNIEDLNYELKMASFNKNLSDQKIETIFLLTDTKYQFISSTAIKEIHQLNGHLDKFIPKNVQKYLKSINSGL